MCSPNYWVIKMTKVDIIKSGRPQTMKEDIEKWIQEHPGANIQHVSHFTAAGVIWTSLFYVD